MRQRRKIARSACLLLCTTGVESGGVAEKKRDSLFADHLAGTVGRELVEGHARLFAVSDERLTDNRHLLTRTSSVEEVIHLVVRLALW